MIRDNLSQVFPFVMAICMSANFKFAYFYLFNVWCSYLVCIIYGVKQAFSDDIKIDLLMSLTHIPQQGMAFHKHMFFFKIPYVVFLDLPCFCKLYHSFPSL